MPPPSRLNESQRLIFGGQLSPDCPFIGWWAPGVPLGWRVELFAPATSLQIAVAQRYHSCRRDAPCGPGNESVLTAASKYVILSLAPFPCKFPAHGNCPDEFDCRGGRQNGL